jgi:tRNA 2-selenouridine synthase
MQVLNPEHFIKESHKTPVVDVRSPAEYGEGHITGAFNIPLFDDRERAVVGTLYTNRGRQTAIEAGLEIIGPKLAEFAREVLNITSSGKLLVYCWRGGMRSESMAWLFEKIGIMCSVLEGGYKAYRNFLLRETGNISKLIVIEGPTGSGKTEILLNLKESGEQVIDFEELASHKGSVFGGIGMESQPTTQQFQNNLFDELLKLDRSQRIWVEGESRTIGKIFLPDVLWDKMKESVLIEIDVPVQNRVKRLIAEYGKLQKDEMEIAISSLAKRLGEARKNEILNDYLQGNLELTAKKLLEYYDTIYNLSLLKYKNKGKFISLPDGNGSANAKILLNEIAGIKNKKTEVAD